MRKHDTKDRTSRFLSRLVHQHDPYCVVNPALRQAKILCGRWLALRRMRSRYSHSDITQATTISEESLLFIETGIADQSLVTDEQCLQLVHMLAGHWHDTDWVRIVLAIALSNSLLPDDRIMQRVTTDLKAVIDKADSDHQIKPVAQQRRDLLLAAERYVEGISTFAVRSDEQFTQTIATRLGSDVLEQLDASLQERLLAGRLLAQLGDLRSGVLTTEPSWCLLTDTLSMPSSQSDPYALAIARYPVTHGQWQHFMDDHGYTTMTWWGAHWEIRMGAGWCQPLFWDDEHFLPPNMPVVGVSWYEALAYCTWLTVIGHADGWLGNDEEIRLPTADEWVLAAYGGEKRSYPWGDTWQPDQANTIEGGVEAPTPVGCYPGGSSPSGVLDLIGNVAEWCGLVQSQLTRMGGSWGETIEQAKAGVTPITPPTRNHLLGFRLVRALKRPP